MVYPFGEHMTLQQLLEAVIDAWRAGDAHRASAFFTPDGTYQEMGREPIAGRDAVYEHFQHFFRDGPLWRFDVEEVLVQGDRAAVCYRFAVKGSGEAWRERAGCAIVHRSGGLIGQWREYHG
ncbi:MAG TPA: nuclear transport factor 2 family protein [Candidatus Baltobacteraceae bacterium]|jgi:uncharacterized protein (TIGR02246 family)